MRVAVLLSGQLRTWRRCVDSHLDLFTKHEVDFYLQTWKPAPHAELIAVYKPSACRVEVPKWIAETVTGRMLATKDVATGPRNHDRARAMLLQWRGVRAVWELAQGRDYDAWVRLRYDLLFRGPLPGLLEGLGDNDCRVPLWRDDENGLNDHLAVMGWRAAEAYCDMYGFLCDRLDKPRRSHPFHFTRNLEEHLARSGVNVEQRAIPYLLVRPKFAHLYGYGHMAKRIFEANEASTFGALVKRNHQ